MVVIKLTTDSSKTFVKNLCHLWIPPTFLNFATKKCGGYRVNKMIKNWLQRYFHKFSPNVRSGAKFRHSRSSAVIISQRRRPAPSCPICLNHRLRACSPMESGHKIGQNTILGECLRIKTVKITSFMLVIREDIPKKCCCSFGFCSNEGWERALPNFFVTF